MKSLRSRLVLAFSLIAVVPLAIAMAVLSQRIREQVRAQAADRLAATTALLEAQLRSDGERTTERLTLLAADPALKRMILVDPGAGPDLAEALAGRRFLLGLDLLMVTDTTGRLLADAAAAPSRAADWSAAMIPPPRGIGRAIVPVTGRPALLMTASVPVRYQGETVALLVGGTALDTTMLAALQRASGIDLVLRDPAGAEIASTLPPGATAPPLARRFPLAVGLAPYATITGLASTAVADRAIATLGITTIVLGVLGVAIAIVLALLWSRQISRPVERLASFSERIAQGDWDEPLALSSVREIETLATALDRMRDDLRGYRDRLRVSERHAAWSQMARQVAHEVKNPLTPIAVSVADLRRSFEQKRPDFPQILDQAVRTIGEEVESLKRLLQSFSELGRMPEPHPEPLVLDELLADLRVLYGSEIAAGRLTIASAPGLALKTDRAQLRQALVNLIQNGLEAVDGAGQVGVDLVRRGGGIDISVRDSGPGLTTEQQGRLFTPGFTTKAHGSGLGLTIVERIVLDLGGSIAVDDAAPSGTTFRIHLPLAPGKNA